MSVAGLLFWIFIGAPIALTVLWWVFMLVAAPFIGIGAGVQAVKERREERRSVSGRRDDRAA
jgi:hypothetical protein